MLEHNTTLQNEDDNYDIDDIMGDDDVVRPSAAEHRPIPMNPSFDDENVPLPTEYFQSLTEDLD